MKGGGLFIDRFQGKRDGGLQSMTYHPPAPEGATQVGGSSNFGIHNRLK